MQVAVDLGNLYLPGEQVGQPRRRLRRVDLLQLGPERRLPPVVGHPRVQDVAANTQLPAFKLPGAVAGRLINVALLAFRVPLRLAVHKIVAPLRRHHEAYGINSGLSLSSSRPASASSGISQVGRPSLLVGK